MFLRLLVLAVVIAMVPAFLHAQILTPGSPATLDGPFQVKIFPNLAISPSQSVINITNTGALASPPSMFGGAVGGNICVNVYVFSPDEQEVACCTCLITPNGVETTSAGSLISHTLTPMVPTAVTVKLIATTPLSGSTCDASTPLITGNVAPAAGALAEGMVAFGTNVHAAPVGGSISAGTYALTETPFIPSTLSTAEVSRITTLCGFINANGSGFGVCPGCTLGAQGAVRQ